MVAPTLKILGGQAVSANRLLECMARDGVCVELLPIDPELPRVLQFAGRIKYLRTFVVSIFYVASLIKRVPRCDLVHVFAASYVSFIVSPTPAIVISKLFGKKILLNYRSGQAKDHLARWKRIVFPILRAPHRIVVPSGYLVDVFQSFGFRAIAIHNVVDESRIRYRERRNAAKPRILVPRTLEPLYDVGCAIRAFRVVQSRFSDASLTILGDGSQRDMLEQMVQTYGLNRVVFTGEVARDRISSMYEQHDIFLNTSTIDNMPVSILEAFAAGLPVVTTNAGGIPYIIRDRENGYMVDVGDHEAVARRLIELVENPEEVTRLSRAGKAESDKYRWDTVRTQWYGLYRDVMQDRTAQNAKAR